MSVEVKTPLPTYHAETGALVDDGWIRPTPEDIERLVAQVLGSIHEAGLGKSSTSPSPFEGAELGWHLCLRHRSDDGVKLGGTVFLCPGPTPTFKMYNPLEWAAAVVARVNEETGKDWKAKLIELQWNFNGSGWCDIHDLVVASRKASEEYSDEH